MAYGLIAFGAYIPRLRLPRRLIAEANAWLGSGLSGQAKGERAVCNWDEDVVTMGVEAARDALGTAAGAGDAIRSVVLCSTTFPFTDRLNAGLLAGALALPESVSAQDACGSQRAATTALLAALRSDRTSLVVAAERRPTKAASPLEMVSGAASAAIVVGEGEPVARLVGAATTTVDFVDHFRTPQATFDYQWEERWVRDAGYLAIVPDVIARCLGEAACAPGDVTRFCLPAPIPRVAEAVARRAGIPAGAVFENLHAGCGDAGTAHSMLMLASALDKAEPGERILVIGFGQGADVLLFEVTEAIRRVRKGLGVAGHLARRREVASYAKVLAFNDLLIVDRGMRAEVDVQTPLSALWRNRQAVTAFIGGRCIRCGTVQFPRSRVCVGPNCAALDTQEPYHFAERTGRIVSYTADRLTYSPDPPACYGMIQFEEGGRWMMDLVDVDPDELEVGLPMRMVFRVKDIDQQRGFRRYFWKAAPSGVR